MTQPNRGNPAQNRTAIRAPVRVEVSAKSEHNFWTGITENVSEGGIFVATNNPPPLGTAMNLTFGFPDSKDEWTLPVVVRWVREGNPADRLPAGVGLQFQDLPKGAQDAINGFVASVRDTLYYDTE